MKIIGLDKPIQYIVGRLKDKLEVSFLEDNRTSEVIICSDLDYLNSHILEFRKAKCECKVLIILDCEEKLKLIRGLQILSGLEDIDRFTTYVKERCTYAVPKFVRLEDNVIEEMVEKTTDDSFFNKLIYPLIQRGIVGHSLNREFAAQLIVMAITGLIKKESPLIVKYKDKFRVKYYKPFMDWLKTEEALKVCECLISGKVKYGFNPFEMNYLFMALGNMKNDE